MAQEPSPAGHQSAGPIAVDSQYQRTGDGDDNDDANSSYSAGSANTSTASLNSSIYDFRKVHGRTFQNFKDAEYWQPNDSRQNDSLDISHHMVYLLNDNRLFHAPLDKTPHTVLDVGTGTGNWAIDFADQFPAAQVIGTDISPTQPVWLPPNCRFELDDASLPWTFPDNHFDFIHVRYMVGAIADWTALYKEAYRCLKPGGWFEHNEFSIHCLCEDGPLPPIYQTWNSFFQEAGAKTGRTFTPELGGKNLPWFRDAGFPADRTFRKNYKVPIGPWPADRRLKEIGLFNLASSEQGLEGFGLFLGTEVLNYTYEEMQLIFVDMRKALKNPKLHASYPFSSTWAQKPLDAGKSY